MNRRNFVRNAGITTAGLAILPASQLFAQQQKIRIGIIGVGLRGQNHLDNALRRSDVEVTAICDIDERMLLMATDLIKKSGKPAPKIFKGDPNAWKKLVELKTWMAY